MEFLRDQIHTFNGLAVGGGSHESSKYISERDFRNFLQIIDFCVKHDNFPSQSLVKELMNELLVDFDHNAYKLRQETQEMFI